MKRLILLLALFIGGSSPVQAEPKAEVLKVRDAAVERQRIARENFVLTELPKWIEKYEWQLRSQADWAHKIINVQVFFEGELEKKLVPGFTKHFEDEGWKVETDKEMTGGEWIVLEITE